MDSCCVYLHLDSNGDIFYVGSGSERRSKSKCKGRGESWYRRAEKGWDSIILYDNLSKHDSFRIEKETIIKLRNLGINITNKSISDGPKHLSREMFSQHVDISDTSKYGLVWKKHRWSKLVGKDAGTLNKNTGYIVIGISGEQFMLHRVVYAIHHGDCPSDLQVNHINGNKQDNRICNLELVTCKQNMIHARDAGLRNNTPRGENHVVSVLKEKDILQMYSMFDNGISSKEISDTLGVPFKNVSQIRRGVTWKHLYSKKLNKPIFKKISDDTLTLAVSLINIGMSNVDIAKITSIEASSISRLRHGKIYKGCLERLNLAIYLHVKRK